MADQKTRLTRGDRGNEVKEIQQWLNTFGFTDDNDEKLDEDGIYGRKTSEAISKFQSESNLKVDGVAGVDTIESILSYEERKDEEERQKETDEIAQGQAQKDNENEKGQAQKGDEEAEEVTSEPKQPAPVAAPTPKPAPEPKPAPTEDPLLQQPQTTTALKKRPVPQSDGTPGGMDPAIQQKVAKPIPRPVPQWSDTMDGSDGRTGKPTPLPSRQNPQATAGNYQKFAKPAKKTAQPVKKSIQPADFNHGMTPVSTDPATNISKGEEQPATPAAQKQEPTPREVPVQAYQSRQAFRQDLNTIYNKFKKIVLGKTHEGMDEIKGMIRSSAQRIKGQENKYPKLTRYLLKLENMRKEWLSMDLSESVQLSEAGFLSSIKDKITDKVSNFFGGDDEDEKVELNDKEKSFFKKLNTTQLIPDPKKIKNDIKDNEPIGPENPEIEWKGKDIHCIPAQHNIFKNLGAEIDEYRMLKQNPHIQKNKRYVNKFPELDKFFKTFPNIEQVAEHDFDYFNIIKSLPVILKKGEKLSFNELNKFFNILRDLNNTSGKFDYEPWEDALDTWEPIDSEVSAEVQSIQSAAEKEKEAKDQSYNARHSDLMTSAMRPSWKPNIRLAPHQVVGLMDKYENDPENADRYRELKHWLDNYSTKLQDFEAEEEAERKAKEAEEAEQEKAKKAAAGEFQKLQMTQVASLQTAMDNDIDPATIADTDDKANDRLKELNDDAQDHAAEVFTYITHTIDSIGWNEEETPPEGHPQRELYIGIGNTITTINDTATQYQNTASHDDLLKIGESWATLEEQLSQFQPQAA